MLRTGKENSRGLPSNWVIIFLVYILSLSSFRGLEFSSISISERNINFIWEHKFSKVLDFLSSQNFVRDPTTTWLDMAQLDMAQLDIAQLDMVQLNMAQLKMAKKNEMHFKWEKCTWRVITTWFKHNRTQDTGYSLQCVTYGLRG